MQATVLSVLALVCALSASANAKALPEGEEHEHKEVEGYYWRNFKGEIPEDALPGGKNIHGHVTYIGQVLHKDQLLPAKIDLQEKKVYFESGFKEYNAEKNVKILCAEHHEQFEWISTGENHLHEMKDKHFVEGGYEDDLVLFIGRKQLPDELVVGKVVSKKDHDSLNITKDGVCVQHGEFEVLSYKPDIKVEKKKKTELVNRSGEVHDEKPEPSCKQSSVVINVYNK